MALSWGHGRNVEFVNKGGGLQRHNQFAQRYTPQPQHGICAKHNAPQSNWSIAPQDKDRSGRRLYFAASRGDTADLVTSLADGAQSNWRHPKNSQMPLHIAAEQGHTEAVRMLLEAGAYVHSEDSDGNLPLHLAAAGGHLEVVRRLTTADQHLSQGDRKSLDWKNHFGYAALHAAAENNMVPVVLHLLDLGADVERKNQSVRTPLHLAAANGNVEATRILIAAGANPLSEDRMCKKPHELARENGHWSIVDFLMDPYGGIRMP